MIIFTVLLLLISRIFTGDPIKNLCFSYLNIGWFGLPVASTILGEEAATLLIAAYVGSSLFGNSIGVGLLIQTENWKNRLLKIIQTPSIWSLLIGLWLIPFGHELQQFGQNAYEVLIFAMGFLGMIVLGIWLGNTRLRIAHLKKIALEWIMRVIVAICLMSILLYICQYYYPISLVIENKVALYLICLLPPAANIIVLETHYMQSGHSAPLIAWNTVISIIVIALYLVMVLSFSS